MYTVLEQGRDLQIIWVAHDTGDLVADALNPGADTMCGGLFQERNETEMLTMKAAEDPQHAEHR